MQRVVADLGQLLVRSDREEHVGRLHADLEVMEVVLLQNVGMIQRALDQRLGVRFAVFFQQMLFQRAGIHANTHRAAMIARGLDDLLHALTAADIAGIDAQARRAAVGSLDRAFVMEMDVRDDRHIDLVHNVLERQCAFLIGARHADDIDTSQLGSPDLRHRAGHVGGQRVGHRLHADRCPSPTGTWPT